MNDHGRGAQNHNRRSVTEPKYRPSSCASAFQMLFPESLRIIVFKRKIPQLLRNAHVILGIFPKVISFGTLPPDMLHDARRQRPSQFTISVRQFFRQDVDESNLPRLVPIDQIGRSTGGVDEALRTTAEFRHLVYPRGKREH